MLRVEPYSRHLVSFHEPGKVRSVRHQGRDTIAQQTMRSHAHSARDWTRNGSYTSAEFGSSLGNQQRTRSRARLHDDRRGGQRSQQAGASDDPVSSRNGTRRNLTNEKADIGDAIE